MIPIHSLVCCIVTIKVPLFTTTVLLGAVNDDITTNYNTSIQTNTTVTTTTTTTTRIIL